MTQYLEHLRSLWCQLIDSSRIGVLAETGRVVIDVRDVDADDGRVAERGWAMVPCQDGQEVFPGQLMVQWFCHPQHTWWEQSESELPLLFSLVFYLCIFLSMSIGKYFGLFCLILCLPFSFLSVMCGFTRLYTFMLFILISSIISFLMYSNTVAMADNHISWPLCCYHYHWERKSVSHLVHFFNYI